MKENLTGSFLDEIVRNTIKKTFIQGAVFYISSADEKIDLISSSGNIDDDTQYYIASINKLFVSAIILKFYTDKKLDLHDRLSEYLPGEIINGLHQYKGKDYSRSLTIAHLMSQTSGLPCYLIDKQANGKKAMDELEAGFDQAWPIDKVIQEVKLMKAHFPPGKEGKAKYADTNHQILGLVVENITGKPVKVVLNDLFQELNLTRTYVCEDVDDRRYVPILYKSETRHLPLYLTSTHNDIISNARDQMTFLKAFFGGYFFPMERLGELEAWNPIFFPFKYGIGIQKFHLPRLLSPFRPVPDLIGHCGSTGSVAFFVPAVDLYITGTINQQAKPNVAFQTMIKIINKLL